MYVDSPRITLQPVSRVIRYNERNVLVFEIAATGVGHVYYLWQKYDSYSDSWISVSSRAVNDTSPTLNFKVIAEEDQGIYHCVATNYDGSVMSDTVTITVFGKLLASYVPHSYIRTKKSFWKAKLNSSNFVLWFNL